MSVKITQPFANRLAALRRGFRRLRCDAILITDSVNVRYLSGFRGDSSVLFITPTEQFFITDFRYIEQAEHECPGFEIIMRKKSSIKEISNLARKLKPASVAVEDSVLTYSSAIALKEELGKIPMVQAGAVVDELRMIKTPEEIGQIRKCAAAAEAALEHIKPFLVPGIRELDIEAELEYHVKTLGFEKMSFPTIVAFGSRGSLPHAYPTNRRLVDGEPILIDWGVSGDGYACDLTRVLFHNKIPARLKRIYGVVLDAQKRAMRAIRPGVLARRVDAAARGHIAKHGFGRRFGHSVGHGIGLKIHELPWISANSEAVLRKGMVFTVEPGIYLPGVGGVRIEDDVLVTASGCEVLTHAPKKLSDIIIGG